MGKIFVSVFFLLAGSVFAASKPQLNFTAPLFNPNAITIPDDSYDGTLASMACMSFVGPGGAILDMSAVIAVDHLWIGDLVIKVVAPDNTVLTLMSRPGLAETADDGTGCCGDSSNLLATVPVTFLNGALTSGEDMGMTINSAQVVCSADGTCNFVPAPDTGPGTDFSQFFGMESSGTWQICVGDAFAGDIGQFDETVTTLNFVVENVTTTVVPPVGTAINMDGTVGPATAGIVVNNDVVSTEDIASISCVFTGPDASRFSITTPMPAGPVAPGASMAVDFSVAPGPGDLFNAVLECTTVDGVNGSNVYRWPVSAFGVAAVIPTLGWWALLALIGLMVFMAWRGHRLVR